MVEPGRLDWPIRLGCNGVTCVPCGLVILRKGRGPLLTNLGLLDDVLAQHQLTCQGVSSG